MALTLKDLIPAEQTPVSAMLHESLEQAMERMRQHDFSQLPVVDLEKRCRGEVVTFSGIVQAIVSLDIGAGALSVKDVVSQAKVYQVDEDLLTTLDEIQRHDFALIVDEKEVLIGVVSTYDTTAFFRHYAQDLMLIEGIETSIKEAIGALYQGEQVGLNSAIESITDHAADIRKKLPVAIKTYLDKHGITKPTTTSEFEQAALKEAEERLKLPKAGKPFEKLSFDEFVSLLLRHAQAPKLAGAKDTSELRKMLDKVRDSRNKLAHFRGDLSAAERSNIKYAAGWLERHLPQYIPQPEQPAKPVSPSNGSPTSPAPTTQGIKNDSQGAQITELSKEVAGEDTTPSGTYAALSKHLAELSTETESKTMKFSEIEGLLGKPLPPAAFSYRAWWANDHDHPQAIAWLNQSWKAQSVSMGDQRLTFVRTDARQQAYLAFFSRVRALIKKNDNVPLRDGGPQGSNWEPLVYLDSNRIAQIVAVFGWKETFRIELYIDDGEAESTKQLFDKLKTHKSAIEAHLGYELEWQPLEDRRACRIMIARRGSIPSDTENKQLQSWAAETAAKFYETFIRYFKFQPSDFSTNTPAI